MRRLILLSNIVPGVSLYPAHQSAGLWLNPDAFAKPDAGTWGNAPRNAVRAPGLWQADMGIERRFALTERTELSLRTDVFNLFNRAQLGKPNATWTDPKVCQAGQIPPCTTFGQITSAYTISAIGSGTPRQMQFSLRLSY